jgi:hypothetical protein
MTIVSVVRNRITCRRVCHSQEKANDTEQRAHSSFLSLSIRKEEEVTSGNKQNGDELVVWLKNRYQRKANPLELSSNICLPLQLNPIQTDCFSEDTRRGIEREHGTARRTRSSVESKRRQSQWNPLIKHSQTRWHFKIKTSFRERWEAWPSLNLAEDLVEREKREK